MYNLDGKESQKKGKRGKIARETRKPLSPDSSQQKWRHQNSMLSSVRKRIGDSSVYTENLGSIIGLDAERIYAAIDTGEAICKGACVCVCVF